MAHTLLEAIGIDGQVVLTSDRVTIHRKGLMNIFTHGLNASHEIPLASISGVDFKDATIVTQGIISFEQPGHARAAKNDSNTVKFNKKQRNDFYHLKEKIFEIIEQNRKHKN